MATTLTTTTTTTVQQEIMPVTTLNADNAAIPVVPNNKTESNIVPIDVEQQPASTRHSKAQLSVIVAALWFSVFLAALDSTITTTALPTITQHFQSSAGYTWVGSAYLLATAASTPTWGKFSDIWGRKPIILAAVSVFFVGSLICGVSTSIFMLIGGRAVQGIGGGGVLTLVNICQSDLFSMRTRVLIFGFESLIWAAAAALGPVLGGVFSETLSWRWCFYINLPAAALAFIILFFFLNLKTPATPLIAGLKAIDWLGSLAIIGTTISVLLGLEFGGVIFAWSSAKVLCLIIFGCVMGGLFLYNEAKVARYPVMPLKLFRHRNNIAAIAVGFLHSLAYISASYYMPLYTQAVRGYSPLQSGISLLPFALAIPISSASTGPIIRSTGRYLEFIWIGLTIMTLGFSLCTQLNSHSSNAKIIIYQILCGVGAGTAYTPPLIALQTSISSKDNATATSTFGFIRNLATAISVVLGGVVFQNGMESQTSQLIAALGPEIASQLSGKEAAANVLLINGLGDMQKAVAREAYSKSLGKMWIMYACFSGASLVASLFLKKMVLSKVHEEVRTGLESEEIKRLELRELDPRRTRVD